MRGARACGCAGRRDAGAHPWHGGELHASLFGLGGLTGGHLDPVFAAARLEESALPALAERAPQKGVLARREHVRRIRRQV